MRYYLLFVLLSLFMYSESQAQCTPVDCRPGVTMPAYGGICSTDIPQAQVNVPYVEQETFIVGGQCFDVQELDSTLASTIVWIQSVFGFSFAGLPSGITIAPNQSSYQANGSDVVGCVGVSGTPTEAGVFVVTLDFTVRVKTNPLFGCPVDLFALTVDYPFSFGLEVSVLPDPSFTGLSASYCANDAASTLTPTGTPGGTFSGPGVSGTSFDPASAGPGVHQVIYSVSAQQGLAVAPASNADTFTVTVHPTYDSTINTTTCDPGSVGTVVQNLSTAQGCDSTVTTVTTLETTPPTAVCQDITIQLDAGGNAGHTASAIDNGSSDACGIASLSAAPNTYTCAELGANTSTLTVMDNSGNFNTCTASVTVEDPLNACNPCPDTQGVPIAAGWNIISSFILPDAPLMDDVMQDISTDIIIVKDATGAVYIPGLLNGIGDWLVTEGYKVKASASTTLLTGCTQVDPTVTPVNLAAGWDIVPYLRNDTMNAASAFASLGLDLIIAKNNNGEIYFPSLGLNNIGVLAPGQGYQVKMAVPGVLTYPANTVRLSTGIYTKPGTTARYVIEGNTGVNATIIIPEGVVSGLENGDEIGVFSRLGSLAGSAVYQGGPLAVTVWGNDPSGTDERMMLEGEPYHFNVWRPGITEEMELLVQYASGDASFRQDGISILEKGTIRQPEGGLFENLPAKLFIFPNPAESQLNMDIWLPAASDAQLRLFDVAGKAMLAPQQHSLVSGENLIQIDLSDLPSGKYIYRLNTRDAMFNGSFVKVD